MQPSITTNRTVIGKSYTTTAASYDEMLTEYGQVKAHWHPFIQALEKFGLEEVAARHTEASRLLRENGVTYVVHGEPHGHRPWELDAIPLIISNADWEVISAGLSQRAELLNLVLTDLYGTRTLIKDGLLPPELVYAHAGFLRACDQINLPGNHQLLTYAADLARGPDGRMWVLSDQTQAPSGTGYALENRTALARVLPNLFGEVGVHRLSFFFRSMRDGLAEIAPHHWENPHVVVLTPGPLNETYFEHAYLASYLGYTLVQGDDLTVLDNRVWLKSLDGLRPVDIILRRVDDIFCDPLELRQDSRLGVAGLLEAIRQGNVVVVNPPGSSVLENPGLIPFLPGIAKQRMGQDLILSSVATWWCGQPNEMDYVLANVEKLVIKTIHRQPGERPAFGGELSKAELDALRTRIHAHPHLYVGQEKIHFSTTPSLIGGKLEPRHAILRSFLFARKDEYVVMPGGLTRSATYAGSLVVSNQEGGVSKDTWILAPEPEEHVSLWQSPGRDRQISVSQRGLSSRAAENLFWVGRYAERAEGNARLLRTISDRMGQRKESSDESEVAYLRSMLRSLTGLTSSHPEFVGKTGQRHKLNLESELLAIALDTKNSGSLVSTLQSLVSAAYAVRDRWSTDTWRVMNNIESQCAALEKIFADNRNQAKTSEPPSDESRLPNPGTLTLRRIQSELNQLMTFLAALTGLNAESMTQTLGWVSLDMGRRIERALLLIVLIRSSLVAVQDEWVENLLLESVLAAAESLITYRGRYRSELHLQTVLELLLLDESNPRSLVYQLKRLQKHIGDLPRERIGYRLSEEERFILEALTQLQLSDTTRLAQRGEQAAQRQGLEKLLVRLAQMLVEISDVLTQTYFSHVQGPQQLVTTHRGL